MSECGNNSAVLASGGIISSSGFPKYTSDFEWNFFKSLVENYFALNAVKDSESQKQLFLAYMPEELLNLVISLVGLQAMETATMEDIFQQLSSYFEAKVPESIRRRDFFRRDRGANESMFDYANALRALAELCDFGDSTDEHLCSCFRAGLNQEELQRLLNNLNGGTFDALVKRAAALECTIGGNTRSGGDRPGVIKVEQDEASACVFKDIGCEFQGAVFEMESHLTSSNSIHMQLLQQKINAQDQQSAAKRRKLEQEVEGLNENAAAQDKERDMMKQTIDTLQREVATQKQQIDSVKMLEQGIEVLKRKLKAQKNVQSTRIEAQEEACSILQKDLLALKRTEYVWCITGVATHIRTSLKQPSHDVLSNTFETHKHGYSVCGVFCPNDRDKKPSQVGLYLALYPGAYDSILPWPFNKRVTFTLHQQSGSTLKDIKKITVFGSQKWKAPLNAKSAGEGVPEFVTQDLLKKYVKDDKVYITLTIEDL